MSVVTINKVEISENNKIIHTLGNQFYPAKFAAHFQKPTLKARQRDTKPLQKGFPFSTSTQFTQVRIWADHLQR